MPNSSIWAIDKPLSGITTPGQSGFGSDGSERVVHIPQSSSITGASTIRLFNVTSRILIEEVLTLCTDAVSVFLQLWPTGKIYKRRLKGFRLKLWIFLYLEFKTWMKIFTQRSNWYIKDMISRCPHCSQDETVLIWKKNKEACFDTFVTRFWQNIGLSKLSTVYIHQTPQLAHWSFSILSWTGNSFHR